MRSIYFIISTGLLFLLLFNACNSSSGKLDVTNTKQDSVTQEKPYVGSLLIQDSITKKTVSANKNKLQTTKPVKKIPEEIIHSDLPDFAKILNVTEKKRKFFEFMRPSVIAENNYVIDERNFVIKSYETFKTGKDIPEADKNKLTQMAASYRTKHKDFSTKQAFDDLLLHVDIIPADLVLTQAAIESAWGTSYFARKVNNIFGQWCFEPGCGVVPRRRQAGETHEVAIFDNVSLAVRSYMLFLNSHPFFSQMRQSRLTSRKNSEEPSAYAMAGGLKDYSARGSAYVKELRSMINTNTKYMSLE